MMEVQMTVTAQSAPTVPSKIWIAIRFLVFGVCGFVAVWVSWLSLILFALDSSGPHLLNPFVAIPLGPVGACMTLYGAGQWGRWAYLWVFVSVPIVLTALGLVAAKYPAADWLFAKPVVILLSALPMPVSYVLVKNYYRRRELQKAKAST
jgi:hypothetical protein